MIMINYTEQCTDAVVTHILAVSYTQIYSDSLQIRHRFAQMTMSMRMTEYMPPNKTMAVHQYS